MAALSLSSARTPQAETIPLGLTIPLDKTSRHHHFDDTQESLIASRWDLFPSCPERNPLPFFFFASFEAASTTRQAFTWAK